MTVNGNRTAPVNRFIQQHREREASALAALIAARLDHGRVSSPWLDAREAASYLRCPLSRVRKLTMQGALPVHRDGRRVLYHAGDLDQFIRDGASAQSR